MKGNTGLFIALAAAVIAVAVCVFYYICSKNKKSAEIPLPENFTLTAHTGCEKTPDNSLEAITKGFESGADIVEFDLNFDESGTPLLAHDRAEKNSVSLEDAFKLIAGYENLKVNIDCKKTDDLRSVVALSEKHGIKDRIFYTGIEEKDVAAVKAQTPDIIYFLNVPMKEIKKDATSLSSLADKIESLGAVGINMKHVRCSKKLIEIFHARNLLVSVWTVNKKKDMLRILPLGADNITTRNPSQIKALIDKSKADK